MRGGPEGEKRVQGRERREKNFIEGPVRKKTFSLTPIQGGFGKTRLTHRGQKHQKCRGGGKT